jgi:hypothetical protein
LGKGYTGLRVIWIADFGFWIERWIEACMASQSEIQNQKSKIVKTSGAI